MECLSGRTYANTNAPAAVDKARMAALSYDHHRRTEAINSRLLQQEFEMKQDFAMKQESSSPPLTKSSSHNLNNNNTINTPGSAAVHVAASAMALSDINAAAAAMGMLTPQQLAFAQTAFLASLHGAQPGLLGGYNPLFTAAWPSPPRSPGPVSPALSAKSSHSSVHRKTPSLLNNNNSHNLNNLNVNVQKKKPKTKSIVEGGPISPAVSEAKEVKEQGATTTVTGRDKTFTCGVCNRSFGYKHVLQNHERTHTGEKPFKCPECNKRFTRDHHLKTHMRLHTGEKPYHCTHCDRHFVQVANLRRHLRVHTGERPYTCTICQSKFSDSNQLKSHVLTHRNQKPFRCELCDASFRRRHHLTGHKCSGRVATHHASSVLGEDVDMYPGGLPLNLTQSGGVLPEQTEPEDLSMRTKDSSTGSPMSSSCSEEDPDESR